MAPTDGQEIATELNSPCPARAEHGNFYGTQSRQQLTTCATEPPSFPIQLSVRTRFKQALVGCVRLLNARACAAGCCKTKDAAEKGRSFAPPDPPRPWIRHCICSGVVPIISLAAGFSLSLSMRNLTTSMWPPSQAAPSGVRLESSLAETVLLHVVQCLDSREHRFPFPGPLLFLLEHALGKTPGTPPTSTIKALPSALCMRTVTIHITFS